MESQRSHIEEPICHLPSSRVTVNWLLEQVSGLPDEEALLEGHLLTTKAGCLGPGILVFSLPSMSSTLDIVGRSKGSSCTHRSPTFKHLKSSFALQVFLRIGSKRSKAFSSFHRFQACEQFCDEKWHEIIMEDY